MTAVDDLDFDLELRRPAGDEPAERRPRRLRRPRPGPARPAAPSALRFTSRGGPIVAVCGLSGGAGASTLAWLLAREAAQAGDVPIAVAELPAASGGLAALAGVAPTRSLGRLLAAGEPPALSPVPGTERLHVLAAAPEPSPELDPTTRRRRLADILEALQAQHGLAVLDCGTLHSSEARAAAELSTHIIWAVAAGRPAAERARVALLDSALAPPPGRAREILAVSVTRRGVAPAIAQRTLRAVAAGRCDRLVLIPYTRELAAGRLRPGARRLATPLAAIGGVLQLEARR
jgi:hypothetical protein